MISPDGTGQGPRGTAAPTAPPLPLYHPAGLSWAETLPSIDFETYSEAGFYWDKTRGKFRGVGEGQNKGIRAVDVARYALDPSTRILCLAYDMADGKGATVWRPGDPPPRALLDHIAAGGVVSAHNAGFEGWIWNTIGRAFYGWPELPISQLRCNAAKARAHGLPGSLDKLGEVLGGKAKKDKTGEKLIPLLSIPQTPSKKFPFKFRTPETDPDLFAALYKYCAGDVATEIETGALLPELSAEERAVWALDQEVNARGVAIDVEGLARAQEVIDHLTAEGNIRIRDLTAGAVETVGQRDRLIKWFEAQGLDLPDLNDETVEAALTRPGLRPAVVEVLRLRASLAQSSVKKLRSIGWRLCPDNRIRDLFVYCGADRSGRWAGRGPQPQNLKAGGPPVERCGTCGSIHHIGRGCCGEVRPVDWDYQAAELALEDLKNYDLETVADLWGDPVELVAGCMRSLFVAGPGHDLIGADFSAIEAVVLAALAGEGWRLEVFWTHGKIYEQSAAKITGIPFEDFIAYKNETGEHHPKRKLGKVAELASGYSGWVNAWCNFGADRYMTEPEIKDAVLAWRRESPAIVEFWGGQWKRGADRRSWDYAPYGLEGAAVQAMKNPGSGFSCGAISFLLHGDALFCRLPSGRAIVYHAPHLHREEDRRGLMVDQLSYNQWDSQIKQWRRVRTYGGKLVENVVQATARDLQAAALVRVNAAGFPPVLHVHDEIIAEVPEGQKDPEDFRRVMAALPAWAEGWPLRVGAPWRGKRYRKG